MKKRTRNILIGVAAYELIAFFYNEHAAGMNSAAVQSGVAPKFLFPFDLAHQFGMGSVSVPLEGVGLLSRS